MQQTGIVSKTIEKSELSGCTDDGEGVSMRIQCADVRNVLGSVHKMSLGGNVVVLDGDRSYKQNKETGDRLPSHTISGA